MDVVERLTAACGMAGAKRTSALQDIVGEALKTGTAKDVGDLVNGLVSDSVPLSVSRPALAQLSQGIPLLPPDRRILVLRRAVEVVHPRAASFPNFDCNVRQLLADMLSEEGHHAEAARTLARINTSAAGRTFDAAEAADHFVKIAELFLEEDLTVEAQNYIKKASEVVHSTDNAHVMLRFRVSYARIQDSQKKFLEASLKYYQLSQTQDDTIVDDDLITLLVNAVTCACLAKAGPQKSRMMDTLHRDARSPALEGYFMLDRMYREQIVRKEEMERFRTLLMPHQLALLPDGMTVYDRSIVQHNMLAASRVYENVTFDELAVLLDVDPTKAETIASTMIAEGRLDATIDQVAGLLVFEGGTSMIGTWDETLKKICSSVNHCCDDVETKYPAVHARATGQS